MRADIRAILALDVPVIVKLGGRPMRVGEIRDLAPGSIIELPKEAEEELELFINNKSVGSGHAVKIEENFGLRITYIGDPAERVHAMVDAGPSEIADDDDEADLLAAQLLGG